MEINDQNIVNSAESVQAADSTTQSVAEAGQADPSTDQVAQDAAPATPNQPPTAASTLAEPTPPISPQMVGNDEQPLLVPLTDYFRKVTATHANVTAFRDMLHTVFIHYATSEEFIHRTKEQGDNQISVLHSLNAGIAMFVERTADYRLGTRQRDPGPLPGESAKPDPVVDPAAYVAYGGDLQAITDVATLQGWIATLQFQSEALTRRYENEIDSLTGQLHGLSETLKLERDQLVVANQRITELENRPAPVATPPAPTRSKVRHSVDLKLHLGYASSSISGVKLVQYALQEYYHTVLQLAFNAVAEQDYSAAYAEFNNAERLVELMAELSLSITDAAVDNLTVIEGPYKSSRPDDEAYNAFMANYLPGMS